MLNFSFAKKFIEEQRLKVREEMKKEFHCNEFKGFEFFDNGQDAKLIIQKIKNISDIDRDIIFNEKEKKISGSIYVDDMAKYEEFVAESMSKLKL